MPSFSTNVRVKLQISTHSSPQYREVFKSQHDAELRSPSHFMTFTWKSRLRFGLVHKQTTHHYFSCTALEAVMPLLFFFTEGHLLLLFPSGDIKINTESFNSAEQASLFCRRKKAEEKNETYSHHKFYSKTRVRWDSGTCVNEIYRYYGFCNID